MAAMFSPSWKSPRLEAPSPKKQRQTWSVFLSLKVIAAPTAVGNCDPMIRLPTRIPLSRSPMWWDVHFPRAGPVALPNTPAIRWLVGTPLAMKTVLPRRVGRTKSSCLRP